MTYPLSPTLLVPFCFFVFLSLCLSVFPFLTRKMDLVRELEEEEGRGAPEEARAAGTS